jgi:Ser/Thr protein kinase RdoA (MazF antagonist)
MEDLDALGYSIRRNTAELSQLNKAIAWLAHFHIKFMANTGVGLWPTGCYWHLATRQEEWQSMPEGRLKHQAQQIDSVLKNAKFQTLVHGDAKLANLCFHHQTYDVAAVDFQYVGQGPGVKDLAYLIGSAFDDQALHKYGDRLLDEYVFQLQQAIERYQIQVDFSALESEVRQLYPMAWADFYRFLIGWNPQSWKICDYMEVMTERALSSLL